MHLYRSQKAAQGIITTYDALLAAWKTNATELDIDTRYGATHVITAGPKDAPPVVLFHGVGDDAALMWIYNAAALAEHFRIFAVDTIGGPGKSRPNARYDRLFDDVLWIDDLLRGLNLSRADFIGVSHGGYMVQLYTLLRSERVGKAVAIAATVPAGSGSGSPMKRMMQIFLPEALFPTKKNTEKLLRKLSGANAQVFLDNPLILSHYRYLLKGFNNMAMGFHRVRPFTDAEIDQIRGRVLYLLGEEDPFQTLGGREVMHRYAMHAIYYPNAGHGLNHELSEAINTKLITHLKNEEGTCSHAL